MMAVRTVVRRVESMVAQKVEWTVELLAVVMAAWMAEL